MFIINFCLIMFRASLCPSSGEQRPCVTAYCIQQNQRRTPYAVTHGLFSPEDGHIDARNMMRQKLIINIWLLQLVGFFLSLHALLTTHGHRNLKPTVFIFAFCTSNFVCKIIFLFQNRYFKILSAFYSVSDVSKEDKWWGKKTIRSTRRKPCPSAS